MESIGDVAAGNRSEQGQVKDQHFMLGAQRWTVRCVPSTDTALLPAEDAGETKAMSCLILIREAHADVMKDTLLHELMHAILAMAGSTLATEDEEDIVRVLAPALDAVLDWKIRGLK